MAEEHLYIVTYDIADARRWRTIFKLMHGYGEWLQLSVFQCRLSPARHADLVARLQSALSAGEDHALVIDIGKAEGCEPRVRSLGKQGFTAVERKPIIV